MEATTHAKTDSRAARRARQEKQVPGAFCRILTDIHSQCMAQPVLFGSGFFTEPENKIVYTYGIMSVRVFFCLWQGSTGETVDLRVVLRDIASTN